MAEIFNEQRVLGVRLVSEGETVFNNQPVIGIREADDGVLFIDNQRVLGVEPLEADQAMYNEQPVRGAVFVYDDRDVYNGMIVVPTSGGVPLPEPVLLEAFDSLTGFTFGNSPTTSIVDGNLQMHSTGTTNGPTAEKAIGTYDPADFGVVAFLFDALAPMEGQTLRGARMNFVAGGTPYFVDLVSNPDGLGCSGARPHVGEFWHAFHVSEVPSLAALGEVALSVRAEHIHSSPFCETVQYGPLYADAGGFPNVLISHDDNTATAFSYGFPARQALGIRATHYLPGSFVGAGGRPNVGSLQAMYDYGDDFACDGTWNDGEMTALADVAAAIASIEQNRAYLVEQGWLRAKDHGCYPVGKYYLAGTRDVRTGVANGTTTITYSSNSVIQPGMAVNGDGVPLGTTVVSINGTPSTSAVLSNAIPTQSKPMSFTDTSGPFYQGKLPAALKTAGFKTMRTSNSLTYFTRFGLGDRAMELPSVSATGLTAAQILARVDEAILRGSDIEILFHGISAGGSPDVTEAVYNDVLAGIATRRDARQCRVVTKSQHWSIVGDASPPA